MKFEVTWRPGYWGTERIGTEFLNALVRGRGERVAHAVAPNDEDSDDRCVVDLDGLDPTQPGEAGHRLAVELQPFVVRRLEG